MSVAAIATAACNRCTRKGTEYYWYLGGAYEFDVEAARRFAADGREPVEVEPDSVRASVENSSIDETHVGHVDPAYPGIITHLWFDDDGELVQAQLLIDGNHRAARCLRDGRPFFAYVLTEDESRAIVMKSPDRT